MALNRVSIIGRLTKAPEIRRTNNGIAVVSFTLAVNRDAKNEQGNYDADFIDCVAWRHNAEFLEKYFTKGCSVVVTGRIQSRKYTDKDGNNRKATEIVADNIYSGSYTSDKAQGSNTGEHSDNSGFITNNTKQAQSTAQSTTTQNSNGIENDFSIIDEDDGELPF